MSISHPPGLPSPRCVPFVVVTKRHYSRTQEGPLSDKLKRLTKELVDRVHEGNTFAAENAWKRVRKDRLPLDPYLFAAGVSLFALRQDRDRALALKQEYEEKVGPLEAAGYGALVRLGVALDDDHLLIDLLEEMDHNGVHLRKHEALGAMHYLCRKRDFIKAFYLLSRMLSSNIIETKAFDLVLSTAQAPEQCYAIYNKMQELRCDVSRDTYDIILRTMLRTGDTERMMDFYADIPEKGRIATETFNVLLLSSQNSARRTFFFWEEMKQHGVPRDVESFNYVLKVLAQHGEIAAIKQLLVEMKELGVSPNQRTSFILRKFSLQPVEN